MASVALAFAGNQEYVLMQPKVLQTILGEATEQQSGAAAIQSFLTNPSEGMLENITAVHGADSIFMGTVAAKNLFYVPAGWYFAVGYQVLFAAANKLTMTMLPLELLGLKYFRS